MKPEEAAEVAIKCAIKLTDYAEVRVRMDTSEELTYADGFALPPRRSQSCGLAVRLWRGGWGFAATCRLEEEAIRQTVDLARALLRPGRGTLAPPETVEARWRGECLADPFALPLDWKLQQLAEIASALHGSQITASRAAFGFSKRKQLFLNSRGARIRQESVETGYSLKAVAKGAGQVVTRSFPNCLGGGFAQAGFEFIQRSALPREARRIAAEAAALLIAPAAPKGKMDLLLAGNQLALQLHESLGHALELDRVLGLEESLSGGSFLRAESLGKQVASPLVNVTADATAPLGVGSFGFDDEGIPAQSLPLLRAGRAVGFLSSREHNLTGESGGAMRAAGWRDLPLIRMTNVNLEPGSQTLSQLIADIDRGLLIDTPNSWSIDPERLNFQFGAEAGYLIKGGKIQGLVRNPSYGGTTPDFYQRRMESP